MSVYIVQGKLGTGKGKFVMGKMRDALHAGKKVVTNFDLWLEHMMPSNFRGTVVRVPDKPNAADLDAAGHGNADSYDEDKNGILVLDELGSWLNSRSFQDSNRAGLLDWLIHARKKGYDCYLIVQNVSMVDKQVREALAEYLVKCIRADKMRIPVIGGLLGSKGKLPRFHIAQTSMADVPGVRIDQEFFRNDDLQKAYDTRQIFRDWIRDPKLPGFITEKFAGPFSYLTPWHLVGRHDTVQPKKTFLEKLFSPRPAPKLKPKHSLIQRLEKLPPDKAWHYARLLNQQGAF